ncbi:MAG TPA: serine/threonine-protein kinase [Polyangiaceae bacterium]|nr:serine/threonine-protein kinase [Polyangiaceae bacterium]
MHDSESAPGVEIGQILAGKYRVDGILGAGGMGVVVAAHHLQLDERVALKFLLPAALGNQEARMRFEREARAAVKIKSEHVARVSDVGTLENGSPYIVMEFLEGTDLAAWLRERGPLPVEQAVEFVLQAGEALAEAHSLGIVHRDVKPSNLFVVRRNDGHNSVKVLDFGISKIATGNTDGSGTKTNFVMGSPFYMSPEQMRSSKDVTAQSDLWSLGVVLYELLSGSSPFTGDTFPEICVKIATEPPPSLRSVRAEVPPELEAVIERCLEKAPGQRFGDVADLAFALQPFAPPRAMASVERIAGILQRTRPSIPAPATRLRDGVHAASMGTVGTFTQPEGRPGHTGRNLAIGVGVALLLAVVGVGMAMRQRGAPATNGPSAAAVVAPPALPSATATTSASVAASAPGTANAAEPPPTNAPPAPPPEPAAGSVVEGHASHGAPAHAHPAAVAPATRPGLVAAATPTRASETAPKAAASSSVNCDPPFYFDANGIRIFKKECVR